MSCTVFTLSATLITCRFGKGEIVFHGCILVLGVEGIVRLVLEHGDLPAAEPGHGVEVVLVKDEHVEGAWGKVDMIGFEVAGSGTAFAVEEAESDTVVDEDVVVKRVKEFKLVVERFKVDNGEVVKLDSFKFFSSTFAKDLFCFLSSFSRSFLLFLVALHWSFL